MKPNFLKSFLICWLLIFSKGINSQKIFSNFLENPKKIEYLDRLTPVRFSLFPQVVSSFIGKRECVVIKPDHYVRGLGVVCLNEWRMDKLMPVQVRFRLGSLVYVNLLERKNR